MSYKIVSTVLVSAVIGVAGLASGPVSAARCGDMPDKFVDLGNMSTWANPGEVISYLKTQGIRPNQPGLTVAQLCAGAPNP